MDTRYCIIDDIGEVWAWDGERLFLVSAELEDVECNGYPCYYLEQAVDLLIEYGYIEIAP
jgi:hypothetical protein